VDLDAVEQVEFVRGPGNAVHGGRAMLAMVNLANRTGRDLDGGALHGDAAAGDARARRWPEAHARVRRPPVAGGPGAVTDGGGWSQFGSWEHSLVAALRGRGRCQRARTLSSRS